jgi:hypothetical protein
MDENAPVVLVTEVVPGTGAIAEEIWHVVHQDRSAWSFNVEVRPSHERGEKRYELPLQIAD